MRPLGEGGGAPDPIAVLVVLALVEPGGTLRVMVGDGVTGIGGWRAAGDGRVVAVAEWLVRRTPAQPCVRVSVRAAAQLSADGRAADVRVQWQRLDGEGAAVRSAERGEALAERLDP